MDIHQQHQRDVAFLKLFLKGKAGQVTDEEVRYFRDHPDQIDEVIGPVKVHLIFLWAGGLLGPPLSAFPNGSSFRSSQVPVGRQRRVRNRHRL